EIQERASRAWLAQELHGGDIQLEDRTPGRTPSRDGLRELPAGGAEPDRGRGRAGTAVGGAELRGGPGSPDRGAQRPTSLGAPAASRVEGSPGPGDKAAASRGQCGGEHFRGRKNRCYRLAVRAVTRAFVKCTKARRLKKRNMRTLWINRITAASQEHGLKYPAFIVNLIKCQVELNRKVLADLAVYEPKTFKSLAALAKRRRQEGFAAALGDGKEPEGVFSRVVQDC
uniref:Mitochondrial ribosomal protein L20 n=1 Tax=Felis catus TaxID=9685 RepID=A0ABI7YH77_FELCA